MSLPLRWELENTGTAASGPTLKQTCAQVVSGGGADASSTFGVLRAAGNGTTARTVSARTAVLAICPAATFHSLVNRSEISPHSVNAYVVGTNDAHIELVRGCAIGGTPTWSASGTESAVAVAATGTTVTGGQVLSAGYAEEGGKAGAGASTALNLSAYGISPLGLTLDAAGSTRPCWRLW